MPQKSELAFPFPAIVIKSHRAKIIIAKFKAEEGGPGEVFKAKMKLLAECH